MTMNRKILDERNDTFRSIHAAAIAEGISPAEDAKRIIKALGYEIAVEAIATMINGTSCYDGRLSKSIRAWAADKGIDPQTCEARHIYKPEWMHTAHLQQLAEVMAEYQPEDEDEDEDETAETAETTAEPETTQQETQTAPSAHDIIAVAAQDVAATFARSAWARGVAAYSQELAASLIESIEYEGTDTLPTRGLPQSMRRGILQKMLLNGASDWEQYSYSACALVSDLDIAERLCTPSELRRCRGGELNPNSRETWLDYQARALAAASRALINAIFAAECRAERQEVQA